jgi:membrane protein
MANALLHYLRSTVLPSKPVQLLIQTGLKWDRDNCPGMAASLSYYALFSLFPMLLVILSLIGWLVGPNTEAFGVIQSGLQRYLPPEVRDLIRSTMISLNQNSVGASIIGFSLLLLTASAIFGVLRGAVNKIWRSPSRITEVGSVLHMVMFFMLNKLLAFLLVFGTALLLLTSLLSNIAINLILELLTILQTRFPTLQIDENLLTWGLQLSASILVLSLATGVLFKILPSTRVGWQDVWLSALLTTFCLVGLQQLVSHSVISIGTHFLSYGVIGSVMILMLWIFVAFQLFLFGCVLSYVYAHAYGSRRHQVQAEVGR